MTTFKSLRERLAQRAPLTPREPCRLRARADWGPLAAVPPTAPSVGWTRSQLEAVRRRYRLSEGTAQVLWALAELDQAARGALALEVRRELREEKRGDVLPSR